METSIGALVPANLLFTDTVCSRLSSKHNFSFFVGDTSIVARTSVNHVLRVFQLSTDNLSKYLQPYIREIFVSESGCLKQIMSLYGTLSRKRTWLFMDRVDRADDNAEALFRYAVQQDDGIDKYFVISEQCDDFERLKEYGNVVAHGSREHKLLLFFAERFISSHTINLAPAFSERSLQNSLANCRRVFLQHGITKDDVSKGQQRYNTNYDLFVTAAEQEYLSILHGNYGYTDDVVKLTGFPRYDYLSDAPQKVILFMPTWRATLGNVYDKGRNENFTNSDYFKALDGLLTDRRLGEALAMYGYKLMFRPHPEVLKQIDDFSIMENVEIVGDAVSYQHLYEIGAICVTDYSSAVFDFAYLKKPVLYYHFDENNYATGYFDYETMGFGEVLHEHEGLVDKIIEHMRNSCVMAEKYQRRVDEFFAYTDRDNCRRVYDAIMAIN